MPTGYHDRVAVVNLSDRSIRYESHGEAFWRSYLGGRALSAYYLLKLVPDGADPMGPTNALVFAPGLASGSPISGAGRNTVAGKGPLSGGYADAEAGGFFGAELKNAGLDALVVTGEAEEPVYLHVEDGQVGIRSAEHLWGKDPLEVEALIKEAHGGTARVSQCGLAGERQIRYANIINDLAHFAGRGGLGAVMGVKHLKAVSAKAKTATRPTYAVPGRLKDMARMMATERMERAADMVAMGTPGIIKPFNIRGVLPSNNFRDGYLEGAEAIDGTNLDETGIRIGRATCYACVIRCKQVVRIENMGRYDTQPEYGGPEYEGLGALGSSCGITDPYAVVKANELCNRYGLDVISTGVSVAAAMEAVERGWLDDEGLGLRFGNGEGLLNAIEALVHHRGRIGRLLAEGSRRLAGAVGHPEIAMQVKGQELPMHDPRYKRGLGVGYAVSPTGADHSHNMHDTAYTSSDSSSMQQMARFGIYQPLPIDDLSAKKARMLAAKTMEQSFLNSLVMCDFVPWNADEWLAILNAITGWTVSVAELLQTGERGLQLTRLFNVRQGFTKEDDMLPDRFFTPFIQGSNEASLSTDGFAVARQAYYEILGWEGSEGSPSRGRMLALGLEEFAASH